LEANARASAGWKGYTTNLTDQTAEFVIGAYHQIECQTDWSIKKFVRTEVARVSGDSLNGKLTRPHRFTCAVACF
jgi:hypothetical protein